VGGDGTIHEVAAGILDSGCDVALGVVPAGSGNDFATAALHLPPRPEEALAIALGGTARRFDVARLNDGWLLNAFGAGIDANVAWDVRALMRRRTPLRGTALYTLSALRQIAFHYHRLPAEKGQRPQEDRRYPDDAPIRSRHPKPLLLHTTSVPVVSRIIPRPPPVDKRGRGLYGLDAPRQRFIY
jgi:hypothetical protein